MACVSYSVNKINFCKEIGLGDVIILVSKCRFLYSRWRRIFYLKSFFREAACAATSSNNVFWSDVYETLFIFSRAFSKKDPRQWEFVRNHRESSGAIKERCAYEPPQLTSITIERRKKGLWCARVLY